MHLPAYHGRKSIVNEFFLENEAYNFLEIKELISLIEPFTPFGKNKLKNLRIFKPGQEEELFRHFGKIKTLESESGNRIGEFSESLIKFRNILESLKKISSNISLTAVDFFEIKRFVFYFKNFFTILSSFPDSFKLYKFESLEGLWEKLDPQHSGNYFFSIDSDLAEELRKEYSRIKNSQKKIIDRISLFFEKKYEIPLKGKTEFLIPRNDIRVQAFLNSKELTLKKEGAFSLTFEIRGNEEYFKLESSLYEIEEELNKEETRYLTELQNECGSYLDKILRQIENISEFDVDISGIFFKKKYGCCIPQILEGSMGICVSDGVNIILKEECDKNSERYDKISADFSQGSNLIIGANMGGKTTAIKTIGQLIFLLQSGFCVPAAKMASNLFKKINICFRGVEEKGLSGFGTEVKRAKKAIESENSLNLFDEFGSGTNPLEGEMLAVKFVRFFTKKENCCSIFVTHFPKTIAETKNVYQTGNLKFRDLPEKVSIDELHSMIDHKLYIFENGKFPFSAFEIAKILGIPSEILNE